MSNKSGNPSASNRYFRVSSVIILILISVVIVAASVRLKGRFVTAPFNSAPSIQSPATAKKPDYVKSQVLRWDLRGELKAIGDRLEKAGKERVLMTGIISRPAISGGKKIPVRLILEFPDRLRIEELSGSKAGVTIFDGSELKSSRKNLEKSDEAEIESLVLDSADHFFASQMQMQATQHLGSHFRLDDGRSAVYAGPFYDIYRVTEKISLKKDSFRQQIKEYYFNSKSLFLEKIRYYTSQNGQSTQAEIQLGGWKSLNAQYLPTSLTRVENGSPTFILSIETVAIGKKEDDGIFTTL